MVQPEAMTLNFFQEIEALIVGACADSVERAGKLLARFGTSEERNTAIDELLLDLMTLVFVIEHGEEGYEKRRGSWLCSSSKRSGDLFPCRHRRTRRGSASGS